MKKKNILFPILLMSSLIFSSCGATITEVGELEIELDDFTPIAYIGEEYDFTDVLYVEDGVEYKLEVYYQNYKTMEEHTLPVVDDFYFTPIEPFDLTVIINAKKGEKVGRRTRIVPVSLSPEDATTNNLEMCNFEPGNWRGTGSFAEVSYSELCGENSKTSRKITFKNSWDLPEDEEVDNPNTVNASFNLAVTPGLGINNEIDSKYSMLSFDIKFSKEFYSSIHNSKHLFSLKIEDENWSTCYSILNLVPTVFDFNEKNTKDGWLHVEQNLSEISDYDDLGSSTYVLTFGFYGITQITRNNAHVFFDNISLTRIPDGQIGDREKASRNNIEMCRFEPGSWRGTGSKAEISYTETYGENSTSSRKITFVGSQDLPDYVDDLNNATVNASFNLANTSTIGVDNKIDAKKCILSFDIKLSEEFFESGHQYRHLFSIKIEDEEWIPQYTWLSFVNDASEFTYENTDNGWIHVSHNLSLNSELSELGNSTYVITFGLFGITTETQKTAFVVFDNISLTDI